VKSQSPAERFARWRGLTRGFFLLGIVLIVAQQPLSRWSGYVNEVFTLTGLALLGLTIALYFRYCNRCPRCGESFSRAPEYRSSETDGLALFGRIERCPFCAEPLRSAPD